MSDKSFSLGYFTHEICKFTLTLLLGSFISGCYANNVLCNLQSVSLECGTLDLCKCVHLDNSISETENSAFVEKTERHCLLHVERCAKPFAAPFRWSAAATVKLQTCVQAFAPQQWRPQRCFRLLRIGSDYCWFCDCYHCLPSWPLSAEHFPHAPLSSALCLP